MKIVFTGARPGEKLAEELFHAGEAMTATGHPGLLLATPRPLNLELLSRGLAELNDLATARKRDEISEIKERYFKTSELEIA